MSAERNLRLVIEYDGSELCGWQRQDNGPTVQEHIEQAIHSMTGERNVITGASRTDAGVHALGQVANFYTRRNIPTFGFWRGLNGVLPPAIAIRRVDEVPADFHSRYSALGKHYRYTIYNAPSRSPMTRQRSWHRTAALDLEAMSEGARSLLGEHDYSAFRAAGCGANTPFRRIDDIAISREGAHVHLDVRGNAFLRNMVRILAGTLVEVGEGRRAADGLAALLASGDRTQAGQTAPAQGLTLVEVYYPDAGPANPASPR